MSEPSVTSNGPWLSICIPTYNRAASLRQTLVGLVQQNVFQQTDDVEVVVSDNASTDDTPALVASFVQAYPSKIRYFQNAENHGAEANLGLALRRGNGAYLKLYNDYLFARPGSLAQLLQVVQATAAERPHIFLTNGNRSTQAVEICTSIDEFLRSVSYYCTWIAGFGLWREQLGPHINFEGNAHSPIPQTDILLRLLRTSPRTIVLNETYFSIVDVGRKRGYNVAEVFGQKFLHLLGSYVTAGFIHADVFAQVKREVLLNYIIPNYFSRANDLDKTGFFRFLQDYQAEPYFYPALEQVILDHLGGP